MLRDCTVDIGCEGRAIPETRLENVMSIVKKINNVSEEMTRRMLDSKGIRGKLTSSTLGLL